MGLEDKFKKETDRVGQLLAALMDRLMHVNLPPDPLAFVETQLLSGLNMDLDEWLKTDDKDDIKFLVADKHFSLDNLRVLGDVLYQLAYKVNEANKLLIKKKALILYEYVNANHNGTLYYDLRYKIKELKEND